MSAREYEITARSTDIFGRVMCSARDHHFIVDGPVQNDCPGEAVTPAEVFLSAVAACSVELIHVIARDEQVPITRVHVRIFGRIDRDQQARADVTLFNTVTIDIDIGGSTPAQAVALVDGFKRRCPLYGTLSVATPGLTVTVKASS